jgi:hypothetical protein
LVNGRVLDIAAVGGALRQLIARTEILETRALVAVSDAVATFRVLRLPSSSADSNVSAAVAREFSLDPERMSIRWVDVLSDEDERRIYAVAWDRILVRNAIEAVRAAGLDPAVADLKSACIARTVVEPACVVVDLTAEAAELVLIDRNLPQVWQPVRLNASAGDGVGSALVAPLRSVLRFYKRRRDTSFDPAAPILICSEQTLPTSSMSGLAQAVGHPVLSLPLPARVPTDVRHATYVTCLGLIMRRTT